MLLKKQRKQTRAHLIDTIPVSIECFAPRGFRDTILGLGARRAAPGGARYTTEGLTQARREPMAQAVCIPTTTDHLLLALCQRADVLGKEIDHINATESDEDCADEQTYPLHEELGTIQVAIVSMRARTFAGAVAKASHVHWCRTGDLTTEMDGPGTDFALCMSIVRDLLAIEAKGHGQ
jgi:hypothetical protein